MGGLRDTASLSISREEIRSKRLLFLISDNIFTNNPSLDYTVECSVYYLMQETSFYDISGQKDSNKPIQRLNIERNRADQSKSCKTYQHRGGVSA